MTTRRKFLRLSALAAAAGCTLRAPRAFADEGHLIYGVQLFMVRRQAVKDLAGILKAIHQIGYTQIELYPIVYNHPAAELRRIVADAGLGAVSGHFDYDGFETKVSYARELGLKYMVCPMLPRAQWNSVEGFEEAARKFNQWGKLAKDSGLTFAFHNHDYEFKPQGSTTGFEVLMKNTDPALVKLEFDMYWLTQAGQNPLEMLKRHAARVRLIHLKDRLPNVPISYTPDPDADHFIELGKGTIDWPAILNQAKRQGIRYAFVDQDETAIPVLDSLKESYSYIRKLNI
ncbi:sugar phosphate isomerase [Edaphobacter acidisoli]|uniref:Sugar phosphate isomerase n=1 Tax=Edaphobacter acidisoli TaxID=2040573 RepID=A0A916RVR7_9BACT|nr:sugar phosphate isomerase/epimerase [Edaphobacter acidisoli]GGA71635.1 sugar phosphate isomerase [Edaphobacter acidisoli]